MQTSANSHNPPFRFTQSDTNKQLSKMSLKIERKYATLLGAVAAAASCFALYAYMPKMLEKADNSDADTVDTELSPNPPELTKEEQKKRAEATAAAHKRLREKCMIKKN